VTGTGLLVVVTPVGRILGGDTQALNKNARREITNVAVRKGW
jgi:hypothetical protein